MSIRRNANHEPARSNWLVSANITSGNLPIQNLPCGLFRTEHSAPRGGVALGKAARAEAHLPIGFGPRTGTIQPEDAA